jgi:hypothetical protein
MTTLVSRRTTQAEHEAFKTRLVNDVFGSDRVQMEKVMMLLWQFRDDPSVVQFMAQFVAKEVAMSSEEWNFTFRNWRT